MAGTSAQEGKDKEIKVARTVTSPALLTRLAHQQMYRRAAGLGASGTGAAIWTAQRLSALALVPLTIWFVAALLTHVTEPSEPAAQWLGRPFNATALGLLLLIGLRHATIGLKVILEDYIAAEGVRLVCVLAVYTIVIVSGAAALISLLVLVVASVGGPS